MEKQIQTGKLKTIAEGVVVNWDAMKSDIKLNSKALYNLIGLKKNLMEKGQQINDTLVQLFESNDCKLNDDGTGFLIPNDKQEKMSQLLIEFYDQIAYIDYQPIIIKEEDSLPADLMDLLFDFIEFQ